MFEFLIFPGTGLSSLLLMEFELTEGVRNICGGGGGKEKFDDFDAGGGTEELDLAELAGREFVTFTGGGKIGVLSKAIPFLMERFGLMKLDPPGWLRLICSVLLMAVKGEMPERCAAFKNISLGGTEGPGCSLLFSLATCSSPAAFWNKALGGSNDFLSFFFSWFLNLESFSLAIKN